MGLSNYLLGGLQVLAGIFLTATGIGAGLGAKLILSGGLTILSGLVTPQGRDGFQSSPRYGFDNIRNTTREGASVPVIYGREMVAPALISQVIEPDGVDQRLRLLYLVGEGEIEAITDVRLNDTPAEQFDDVSVVKRYGTADQLALPGFEDVGTAWPASTTLDLGEAHVHTGKADVDAFAVNLTFPGGLFGLHKDGSLAYAGFNFTAEIAAGDDPAEKDWKPILPAKLITQGAVQTYNGHVEATSGLTHVGGNRWQVAPQSTQSPVRVQMRVRTSDVFQSVRGTYSIRITGAEAANTRRTNIPTVVSVIEIVTETRRYLNRALLGLVIPATAQLAGGTPRVTCLVDGRKVEDPRDSSTAWSRNPVLCARDLLLSERYGLGAHVTEADLDDGSGGTWRDMADAMEVALTGEGYGQNHDTHQLDLVLDVKAPARDWLTQILTSARLNLYQSDGLLKLSQDAEGAAVTTFSEDEGDGQRKNILAVDTGEGRYLSSLVDRELPASERWTRVRARFVDRHKDYAQQVIEVGDQRFPISGSVTSGPFEVGEKLQVGGFRTLSVTTAAGKTNTITILFTWTGYLARAYADGDPFMYVAPDDATKPWPDEYTVNFPIGITGWNSNASVNASGHLTRPTPERALEIQLYGVTRMEQAVREARFHLNRATLTPGFCSFGVALRDLDLEPGDVIEIDSSRLGWSSKAFTVLGIRYGMDGTGRVEAREYDADAYDDQVDNIQPFQPTAQPQDPAQKSTAPKQSSDSNQAEDQTHTVKPFVKPVTKTPPKQPAATSGSSISGTKPANHVDFVNAYIAKWWSY